MPASRTTKTRDAVRTRTAILDAAERVFANRGFDATSLHEIAAAARVSRATPSYFFGSKKGLYVAVLERVFTDRQLAAQAAFEPLEGWVRGEGDSAGNAQAAMPAWNVGGYANPAPQRVPVTVLA